MRHEWRLDARGEVDYFEFGGFHGGPICEVCGFVGCQHEPDFDWEAECPGPDDDPPVPAKET